MAFTTGDSGVMMAGSDTLTFNDADFDQEVIRSGTVVVVDFWAEWCQPCKILGPVIDRLATTYKQKARVGKLDIATNPQAAARFGITHLPTVIVFHDGEIKETMVGVRSEQDFQKAIDKLLS